MLHNFALLHLFIHLFVCYINGRPTDQQGFAVNLTRNEFENTANTTNLFPNDTKPETSRYNVTTNLTDPGSLNTTSNTSYNRTLPTVNTTDVSSNTSLYTNQTSLNNRNITGNATVESSTPIVQNQTFMGKTNVTTNVTVEGETRGMLASTVPSKNHASFSTFSGNVTKFETGTVGDGKETNGSQSMTKYNETWDFGMAKNLYTMSNVTSVKNCSGCLLSETKHNETQSGRQEGKNETSMGEQSSGNDEGLLSDRSIAKECEVEKLTSRSPQRDMFSSDDDDDVAGANINCLTASRRRLVSTHRKYQKTTHANGTSSNDEKKEKEKEEEEKNKERQQTNAERAKYNEDRNKDLDKTKYKILNDIYDEPIPPAQDTQDDRNFENKTIPIDVSMLPSNETEPDHDHRDANVGIVGMDTHLAIEPKNHTSPGKKQTKKLNAVIANSTNANTTVSSSIDPKIANSTTANTTASNSTDPKITPEIRIKRILCFGDSLTKGFYEKGKKYHPYTTRLRELLEDEKDTEYKVFTHGINGECVYKAMKARLPDDMKEVAPLDLVILLGGTNDLLKQDCAKGLDLFKEIKDLHEIVHKKGIKSVIVTIPETAVGKNGTNKMSKNIYKEVWAEVNQKLRMYAYTTKAEEVLLSDVADEFPRQTPDGAEMKGLWDDEIHPSREGYDKIGEIIYKDIKGKF